MKKIIFLSGIIIMTLVSCSTDDAPTYNEKSSKTRLIKENDSYYFMTSRDTLCRDNDSINESVNPKPIKP